MFAPEHQPTSFQALVEQIRRCNAFTVVKYMVQEYRILFEEPAQRQLLERIDASNDVDEIRLFCAEHLGDQEEVQKLTRWLEQKKMRPKPPSLDSL